MTDMSVQNPEMPKLWNPNAAANWCLIFSPAFGSYLHMLNWRALGEQDLAAASKKWFAASIVLLVLYILFAVTGSHTAQGFGRLLGLVFLLSWYFGSAKAQAKYVKDRFGSSYIKKSWEKPLGIGLLGIILYSVAIVAAVVVVTAVR